MGRQRIGLFGKFSQVCCAVLSLLIVTRALQGDYYVRDGQVNKEETYGVYNADWSGLRNGNLGTLLGGLPL